MPGPLIRLLPAIVIGAAGAASLAYSAWRRRTPATYTRALTLASLRGDLRNWLPKLPFIPFIRIEVPETGDWLLITGDDGSVNIDLPQATVHRRRRSDDFRRICSQLGYPVREVPGEDDGPSLRCCVPAGETAVAAVLEDVLRGLFRVDSGSRLVAAVPSGA